MKTLKSKKSIPLVACRGCCCVGIDHLPGGSV